MVITQFHWNIHQILCCRIFISQIYCRDMWGTLYRPSSSKRWSFKLSKEYIPLYIRWFNLWRRLLWGHSRQEVEYYFVLSGVDSKTFTTLRTIRGPEISCTWWSEPPRQFVTDTDYLCGSGQRFSHPPRTRTDLSASHTTCNESLHEPHVRWWSHQHATPYLVPSWTSRLW